MTAQSARLDQPKLSGIYIGKAGDFTTTEARLERLTQRVSNGEWLDGIEEQWLIATARAAIAERDELQKLVAQCADTIINSTSTLEGAMATEAPEAPEATTKRQEA